MKSLHGQCHCGNVEVQFQTDLAPAALALRACGCTFCRAHGSRAVTDPKGTLAISVRDVSDLIRYRFGQRTADFLICGRCGIFVAAVMETDGESYATLNANALDCAEELTQPATPFDYDAETAEQRTARRKTRWTPLTLSEGFGA